MMERCAKIRRRVCQIAAHGRPARHATGEIERLSAASRAQLPMVLTLQEPSESCDRHSGAAARAWYETLGASKLKRLEASQL
mmetsp:Transcript_106755/g.300074  ORF Transcript_106755/g.300074 Transcript_106755/m.300074 type:complete len:82 (+) Transcript_106755:792-1037(+)